MIALIGATLMMGGLAFVIVGAIGLLRLPDFYARLHAISKCDTLGLALMVAGVALHVGPTLTAAKVLLLVIFVGLLNATAAHTLGRAAYRSGLKPWIRSEGTARR